MLKLVDETFEDICVLEVSPHPKHLSVCVYGFCFNSVLFFFFLYVVLTYVQKFFDALPSRKWSVILFLLDVGWA